MKIKVTIWFEDEDVDELTNELKTAFKDQIEERLFGGSTAVIKQVQIEETEFED